MAVTGATQAIGAQGERAMSSLNSEKVPRWGSGGGRRRGRCGLGATPAPPAEKAGGPRQKLEVWRPGAKEDRPWGVTIDEALFAFNKSQSGWEVEVVYPGAEYAQKVTTQVVAGNPPAAFRGWVNSVQSMAPTIS